MRIIKKVLRVLFLAMVLIIVFAVAASAAELELIPLRAGGSVGGGGSGGGGFGRLFRIRGIRELLDDAENMNGKDLALGIGLNLLLYAGYVINILAAVLIPIIVNKRKKKAREESRRLMAQYDDFDGFWSYEFVRSRIEEIYFAVQEAWGEGDMKKAEDMVTPAIFKKYQKHLDAMRRDGEKNILKKVQLKSATPVYAKDFTNNEYDYLWCKIEGSMIDYVINVDSNKILQGNEKEEAFDEYWRLTRRRDGMWVLAEIMQTDEFEKTRYYKGLSKL